MAEQPPEVVLTPDFVEKVRKLKELRAWMAEAKKASDALRAELLQELGEASVAMTASGEPVAHVDRTPTSSPNRKKLQALYPEVWNAVVEEGETVILKIDLAD